MTAGWFQDRRVAGAALVGLALVLAFAATYIPSVSRALGTAGTIFCDTTLVAAALLAAGLSFWLARASGRGEVLRTIWLLLGLGLLLWAAGEAVWAIYELVLREEPGVTVGDAFWLLGFVPLSAALVLRFRSLRAGPEPQRVTVAVAITLVLVVIVAAFVFRPIAEDVETPLALRAVNALYPLGDLVLVHLVLLVVFVLAGGALSRPWLVIGCGFLLLALADLLYAYAVWQDIYQIGPQVNLITALSDIPYYASYILILLGVIMQARLQRIL